MITPQSTMAQQVAQAMMAFQEKTTGHAPTAVTVVLSGDTLVITLHNALSPAEKAMAKSPTGAAKVQEFHRQLFSTSSPSLRKDIRRITGVDVREAVTEVEPSTGTVVCAFASGTMVQVFQLVHGISADTWNRKKATILRPGRQSRQSGGDGTDDRKRTGAQRCLRTRTQAASRSFID